VPYEVVLVWLLWVYWRWRVALSLFVVANFKNRFFYNRIYLFSFHAFFS